MIILSVGKDVQNWLFSLNVGKTKWPQTVIKTPKDTFVLVFLLIPPKERLGLGQGNYPDLVSLQ